MGVWGGIGPRGIGAGVGIGPLRASSGLSYGEIGELLAFLVRFLSWVIAILVIAIWMLYVAVGRGLLGLGFAVGGGYLSLYAGGIFAEAPEADAASTSTWEFAVHQCLPALATWAGLLLLGILVRLLRAHLPIPLLRLGPRALADMA